MNIFKKTVTLAAAVSLVCLSSAGAMAANKLIVKDAAGTSDVFVVTDTGYTGIGTSAPLAAIHVMGSTITDSGLQLHFVGTTAGGGGSISLLHNNGTSASMTVPVQYDRLGSIAFSSYVNTTTRLAGGLISGYADGTWSTTSAPTYISFQTAPSGSTTRAERMKIASNGNVGIGTSSPSQKLEVNGGVRIYTATAKPATCSAAYRGLIWYSLGATGVADTLQVCAKDSSENYAWRTIY